MRILAIGDIHGQYKEMVTMVEALEPSQDDIVVFLGDYIDRGDRSSEVIEQLINWSKAYPRWEFLLGNHEQLFLDYYLQNGKRFGLYTWLQNGGDTTRESYKPDNLSDYEKAIFQFEFPTEHLSFITDLNLWFETDEFFFVHGGLIPEEPIDASKDYPDTILWAREGFIDSDWDWGKKIIFGHTPALHKRWNPKGIGYPIIMKNKLGLDGAVCPPGRKALLAADLTNNLIYRVETDTLFLEKFPI